ncbi:methionine adenosyltransferase [Enterococcus sp. 669A]|uniref:S-adenosylmethionine synthase n=1 Tax=Candidatus Enterococcus moelleringii TaxID=2815325 RepID=A0ABS3LB43_9ENTE|nr:methionine adenosyltransferase [Enterococcus sp. 669A]MBO1305644.1 methionine adenosyltransferase [Enterococcus sp. 669A]
MNYLTSESVTKGHPDKLCDQISDRILDAFLTGDPESRVAVECMISNNLLVIAGEVTSSAQVDIEAVARTLLQEVGYTSNVIGIDAKNCIVLTNLHQQSPDISQGVDQAAGSIGAGDQGSVYGYACNETVDFMPLPIHLAHALTRKLDTARQSSELPFLLPDGKAQVTILYNEKQQAIQISDVVLSTQHIEEITVEELRNQVREKIIAPVLPAKLLNEKTRYLINPTGRFVIGGPFGDTGLTGRKIIVDTYGGVIPHGGGAFSGKDGTKVDRSGAYMARYIAKNIVAAGFCQRCQIALSYAIGYQEPVAIDIKTFGTSCLPEELLKIAVLKTFDLSPRGMIDTLQLKTPLFKQTSVYGHFNNLSAFPWEKLDKVETIKRFVKEFS